MFIVYKTTNLITGHYYIGVHKTLKNEFDGYYGSGVRIKLSIKKYGKNNFTRITLFSFDNEPDAFKKEKELVDIALQESLCLNLSEGGRGGSNFKGHHHSDETKEFLRQYGKLQTPHTPTLKEIEKSKQTRYDKNNGKYFSKDSLEKIAKNSRDKGELRATTKEKISNTLSQYYSNPDNREKQSLTLKAAYSDPSVREKHKQAMAGNGKGKLWMINNITKHRTRIDAERRFEFEANGYVEGYKFKK